MKWTFFIILALLFFACDNKVEINTCDNKDCKSLGDKFCDGNNLYVCLIKDGCLEKQQIKRCENGCNQDGKCNECTKTSHCEENATCNNNTCECNEGYHKEGGSCVKNEECTENSCSGNGKKADGFDENGCKVENEQIVCNCDKGYEGTNCENDINECSDKQNPVCKNGGKCTNKPGSFTCECTNNFEGETCERCQDGYFKFETEEENVECKKRISCKISPEEVNNDSDNNFDGRIYLTLEGKDLNTDDDLKPYINDIKLVIKKINGTQKTYKDKTQIPDSTKFYFDLNHAEFPFKAKGEYNYHIELSAGENNIINCDTDGSDNDESNDSDSTKKFTDEKRGKIKVDCVTDNNCNDNNNNTNICIYGKCEEKATGTEDCKVANFRGHEYKFCGYGYDSYGYSNTKTWEAAKTDCGTNSHLVKIENAVENEWIKKNIGSNQFWIGLHRNNNNSPWRWDGESEDANLNNNNDGFSDWSDNNEILSDENCSFMQKSKNGSWYSALLAYHLYICESESSN